MKKQVTALITAALILANFTACNSDSEPSGNLSDNSSVISDNSEENQSETASESENSQTSQTQTEEPTFLVGPAGDPIYPSDITWAEMINKGNYLTDAAEFAKLTEDNFSWIQCDGFEYLREPTGIRYNRYESPEKFESESPYSYIGEELANENPIKRVYDGEEICAMTVTEAGMSFHCVNGGYWYDSNIIKFKGEKKLTGYLSIGSGSLEYGLVTFWLDEESDPVPTGDIPAGKAPFTNGYGTYGETVYISLGSIYAHEGATLIDEAMLDGITYGDRDVHVKITIDDYVALGYGDGRATLKSLERL